MILAAKLRRNSLAFCRTIICRPNLAAATWGEVSATRDDARRESVRRGGFMSMMCSRSLLHRAAMHDGDGTESVRQSDGPYFKPSSPETRRISSSEQQGADGSKSADRFSPAPAGPVPRARTILWHAEERRRIRHRGFRYLDIYSRMMRDAIASAPFCRRLHRAAPAIPRQGAGAQQGVIPRSSISPRSRRTSRTAVPPRAGDAKGRAGDRLSAWFAFVLDMRSDRKFASAKRRGAFFSAE